MEVVLGIDNLTFISILTNKLPAYRQAQAGRTGIGLALILIARGLLPAWKTAKEIHQNVDRDHGPNLFDGKQPDISLASAIVQILMLDLIFSVDSIITTAGMTDHVPIMAIVAVTVMLLAADPLSCFVQANPTMVMLALDFLLMTGMTLIADGFGVCVPKSYIYAAMAFSALVEALNILLGRCKKAAE